MPLSRSSRKEAFGLRCRPAAVGKSVRSAAARRAKIIGVKTSATRRRPLPRRTATGALAAALLAFPVLGGLLSDLLPQGEAYGAGDLPLLAALWGLALTGCAGHLLAGRILLDQETLLQACAAFSRGLLPAAPSPVGGSTGEGEPRPPVPPLLSSYFALYAGLGGWVDGRARSRETVRRFAGGPAPR
jgi:hypothetical protein